MPSSEEAIAGETYTIGDLAKHYNVSLRTLRFYEERELLRPSRDRHRRLYTCGDRLRLETILKAKRLGFSLTEIWNLLEGRETEADVTSPASAFLNLSGEEIKSRIEHLRRESDRVTVVIEELRQALSRCDEVEDAKEITRPYLVASSG